LAEQNKMFYDLFRGPQSELIADGLYRATGQDSEISEKQWSGSGRWLDISNSDLVYKSDRAEEVLYERVSLRRRGNPAETRERITKSKPSPVAAAVAAALNAEGLD
jgi:hypothetical protein